MKVVVVVLGDVGRSPRMQYHAISLSEMKEINEVCLIGLKGVDCMEKVQENINVKTFEDIPINKSISWIFRAPFRAIRNCIVLFEYLIEEKNTNLFLVQNPPAIPTLFVISLASWWIGSTIIIDWHNLGFKMLEHGGGRKKFLSKFAKVYEHFFSKFADNSICVTNALSIWLKSNFLLIKQPTVVYDCPYSSFRSISEKERIELFQTLNDEKILPSDICQEIIDRKVCLVVTSTSWTEDEDFSMLLDGLINYSSLCNNSTLLPPIVLVVTGKGPLLKEFEPKMKQMEIKTNKLIRVYPVWLSHENYRLFLAACDLGISMHTSTSGLDLPMKVVDMFGVGLPVCAVDFQCLSELVKDGENGLIFNNSQSLSNCLVKLLKGFPNEKTEIFQKIHKGAKNSLKGWDENWKNNCKPIIIETLKESKTRIKCKGIRLIFSLCVIVMGILVILFISFLEYFLFTS